METNQNWNIIETDGDFHKIQDPETSLFGLVYKGKLVSKPICWEVTRLPNSWYIRNSLEEGWYNLTTGEFICAADLISEADSEGEPKDGSIVTYTKGKGYGFINKDGKVIFENQFDSVYKWPNCDVVMVRNGGFVKYFDTQGNEILKNVRYIPSANDFDTPYSHDGMTENIVQTVDLRDNPIGDDFCTYYGVHAGLSRRTKSEHIAFLKDVANLRSLSTESERLFLNRFSVLHDCYVVQSSSGVEHPVYDCIKQLIECDALDSDCMWIIVVVLPKAPNKALKREIEWLFRCISEDECHYFHKIAYGTSEDLKEGAIVYATRYIYDDYGRSTSYHEKKQIQLYGVDNEYIKSQIRERGFKSYDLKSVFFHILLSRDEWHSYEELADWLIDNGCIIPSYILSNFPFMREADVDRIKWLLKPEHSTFKIDINRANFSKTVLDKAIMRLEEGRIQQDFIDFLIENGAKTFKQKRAEESAIFGYDFPVSFILD